MRECLGFRTTNVLQMNHRGFILILSVSTLYKYSTRSYVVDMTTSKEISVIISV